MDLHSHLSNAEPAAIEALYRQFLDDPNSVDPTWRHFFLGFDFVLRPFIFSSDKYNVYSGILLKEEYMYCWIKSGKNSFRNEMFESSRNFKINPFS
mgnify:CR=1 FL=1